jgi:hypothetical protein
MSDVFVGREAEARAILVNTEARRCSLIVGEAGLGKSALLAFLEPALHDLGKPVLASRVQPFGTFLREAFEGLWALGLTPKRSHDLAADLKAWGKRCPSNDQKAAELLDVIRQHDDIILVIDDASGVTPTSRPWLEHLTEACTVIAAVSPEYLRKGGTKRFWKRFEEVRLEPLSKREASELLERLMQRYRVNADEPEVYRRRVLELAQGVPFELERLVKYHSAEALVKTKDILSHGQAFVERDEKGVSLAPLLLVAGAMAIAGRYIARAQGDLDLYVLAGIGIGLMVVFGPWLRHTLRPRSR